MHKINLIL